jgi:hypothetical protein
MALTAADGFRIRKEYSEIKEREVCDAHNLTQKGGSRTKIDGENDTCRKSIKNASGSSTQVHLTTQKHFIEVLKIKGNASEFIRHFCGSREYDFQGRDRRTIKEVDPEYVESFQEFLENNTERIIDLIVRNGDDITHVVYRDITNQVEYEITYEDILEKVKSAEWKFMKGGIHLKLNGKTLFHFQREGKRNPSNRYNVLWHIHRNLFQ